MNDSANPYAAPAHGISSAAIDAGQGWAYLGFWRRAIASIIDNILMMVLGIVLALIFALGISDSKAAELIANILGWITGIVFVLGFWIARNATPGKMVFKAEIRDARTFGKPRIGQYILRYVGYIPSTLVLGMGFIWVAIDKRKRGWHDIIAGTVVVCPGHDRARPATRTVRRPPPHVRPGQRPAEDLHTPASGS